MRSSRLLRLSARLQCSGDWRSPPGRWLRLVAALGKAAAKVFVTVSLFWEADGSIKYNARALSGAGKRTAASGVAWSGCASLRGPLCAGEALLEARTQASVALFKLGAHSATLRPEFGGPKSLRCCCAKGVGHRAQLMLRARRGDRENNHPVPLLRTPTPQNALSLLSSLRGVTTTKSLD